MIKYKSSSQLSAETETSVKQQILKDQVQLLYEQLPVSIIAQIIISTCLFLSLLSTSNLRILQIWYAFFLLAPVTCGVVIYGLYKIDKASQSYPIWIGIFSLYTLFSGIGWGTVGSFLMPETFIHQCLIIIILGLLSAGATAFFSPILRLYTLFLLTALSPLVVWCFIQGQNYTLVGYCGLIYMASILICAYYSNKVLTRALFKRYNTINLDIINHMLDKRVTERTSELENTLAITKSTLESTADGIAMIDLEGNIAYYNKKFLDMWQIQFIQFSQPDLSYFFAKTLPQLQEPEIFLRAITEFSVNQPKKNSVEIYFKNGNVFEWYSKPYYANKIIAGQVWSFRDITLHKKMEYQLSFQANHDVLTSLPNRNMLYKKILSIINADKNHNPQNLVVFFIDIDNFKLINDSFGHDAGDILLQIVAQRLQSTAASASLIARFGGDEFVILYTANTLDKLDIIQQAESILQQIISPIKVLDHELIVTVSMGISIYPQDGVNAESLLKAADMAMYMSKLSGRNTIKFFDNTTYQASNKNLEIQIDLRAALANNQIYLLYQPVICLKTGKIIAVEALARLHHPTKGIILPEHFIPVAENSGIIVQLGEWVFRHACIQKKAWDTLNLKPVKVAINISGVQILRENFVDFIYQCINETGVDPHSLEFELTESILIDNKQENMNVLQDLQKLGISLVIDDFGTGYSNLSYLSKFPISKLKIALPFVKDCVSKESNNSIINAIIAMGHGLGMRVLAEGIETVEQLQYLQKQRCDEGQGFLFQAPVSAEIVANLLLNDKSLYKKKIISKK